MVYSVIEREMKFRQFIKLRAQGATMHHIRHTIDIGEKAYYKWCKIDDEERPFLTVARKGGPPSVTTDEDNELLREKALENRWSSLDELRQLPEISENRRLSDASDSTLKRKLKDKGVRHRIAASKELLTDGHKERRLMYAEQFIDWALVQWSSGIFIDEFAFCTSDAGQCWVWRENGTRYNEENLALIQRTRRFSVSFIVCFHGIGPIRRVERLTKESYVSYLDEDLKPYIEKHFDDGNVLLLHDNHPAHTSNHVKDWICDNIGSVEDFVFPHPSLSPDLNPVEQVGGMIKGMVRAEHPIFNSQDELWMAIERAHHSMCTIEWRQYFIKLLNSMPKRMGEVIAAQGGHTSY